MASNGRIIANFYTGISTKISRPIPVWLKSDNVTGCLHTLISFAFIMETGCVLCVLRTEAEETVNDLDITIESERL